MAKGERGQKKVNMPKNLWIISIAKKKFFFFKANLLTEIINKNFVRTIIKDCFLFVVFDTMHRTNQICLWFF